MSLLNWLKKFKEKQLLNHIPKSQGRWNFVIALLASISLLWSVLFAITIIGRQDVAFLEEKVSTPTFLLRGLLETDLNKKLKHLKILAEKECLPALNRRSTQEFPVWKESSKLDPEILDFSLWEQVPSLEVFNSHPQIRRIYSVFHLLEASPKVDPVQQMSMAFEAEAIRVQPAFYQHSTASLSPSTFDGIPSLFLATSLGAQHGNRVVAAHVDRQELQKFFYEDNQTISWLVDDFGNILASTESLYFSKEALNRKLDTSELFLLFRADRRNSGQVQFIDHNGYRHFGSYSRLSWGPLAVLTEASEQSFFPGGLGKLKWKIFFFVGLSFLFLFVLGYRIFSSQKKSIDLSLLPSKRVVVTTLFGSCKNACELIQLATAKEPHETFDRFYQIILACTKNYEGHCEQLADISFYATWEAQATETPSDHSSGNRIADHSIGYSGENIEGVWSALRCVLALRAEFNQWNAQRRLDGLKEVVCTFGVHTAEAWVVPIIRNGRRYPVAFGSGLYAAKQMAQLGLQKGHDIFISENTWHASEGKFIGSAVTQIHVTDHLMSRPTGVFGLQGYRNEQGQEVAVAAPSLPPLETLTSWMEVAPTELFTTESNTVSVTEKRWLVSNGSQILGPLNPTEIAQRLFTQEIDFDSDCWSADVGTSAPLKNAGIFSGSARSDAFLWVFDGKIIHGPVTPGFLKTALGHQAVSQEHYVCEGSTLAGWSLLKDYYQAHAEVFDRPTAEVAENNLTVALTPPGKKTTPSL